MSTPTIRGTHPYADEFPMASEEEIQELTESIATVGLIHPVILTEEGLVLDGRNRLEACRRAEVTPTFEIRDGDDDDFKEFVIGVNTTGRRESMTVQIAAASTALILGAEKRINGQWRRGAVSPEFGTNDDRKTWKNALSIAGKTLDVLGRDALAAVRDGRTSLNAVYEQAQREREAERRAMEDEKKVEVEEAEAKAYLEGQANGREYLLDVEDGTHKSYRHARAAYLEDNRREKAKQEQARRDREESWDRDINRLEAFLMGFDTAFTMREHPEREEVLNRMNRTKRDRFLKIEEELTWPASRP